MVKQETETDPVRKEIADQMKPNTRGYYAILVPRNDTGIRSAEVESASVNSTKSTWIFCRIRWGVEFRVAFNVGIQWSVSRGNGRIKQVC